MATDVTQLDVLPRNGCAVVHLSGDIDLESGPLLTARLEAAAGPHGDVVADLSEVSFIDCAGLSALIRARDLLPGRLWLRAPAHSVAWLLQATGVRCSFAVLPDPAQAPSPRNDLAPSGLIAPGGSAVERLELQVAELQESARYWAVIEQAKGLLMAIHGCTASDAGRQLSEAASTHQVHVRDLAAALAAAAAGPAGLPPGAGVLAARDAVMPERTSLDTAPASARRRRGTIALRSVEPSQMSVMLTRKARG